MMVATDRNMSSW